MDVRTGAFLWAFVASACVGPGQAKRPMTENAAPIVQVGRPVLRQPAKDVPESMFGSTELIELTERMVRAMREAPGVGLAAPQIGIPLRIFVLEDPVERQAALSPAERTERERTLVPLRIFINPKLRFIGETKRTFFEGCLSVSGYAGLVERAHEVEVEGFDVHGKPQSWRVQGWPARILQHEFDHLEGTLYIDRMFTRSFGTADSVKERFTGKPIVDVRRELGL